MPVAVPARPASRVGHAEPPQFPIFSVVCRSNRGGRGAEYGSPQRPEPVGFGSRKDAAPGSKRESWHRQDGRVPPSPEHGRHAQKLSRLHMKKKEYCYS